MFRNIRRALLGFAVIASSTVAIPVTTSVVTASDGSIDSTGWASATGGLAQFASQFTVNGSNVDFRAAASAATSDGGLMVAGYVGDMDWYTTHMALVRITSAGALDTNFGSNGIVILDRGLDNGQQIYAAAEAIYPTSGGFLVGGWSGTNRMAANATLTKVDNNGNVVSGWGVGGTIKSHVASGWYPSFSVSGGTILMSSDDSGGSAYVHRFSEATGAPVAVGMGSNNYLTINTSQAPFTGRVIKSVALGTQFLIVVSVGGSPETATVHRFDLGFASLTDSTATLIPADIFKGIVRAGNSGFWLVGSSGNQNNSSTSFTLLNPDGTLNPTYGLNSDGYVHISNFSIWSGGAWNGTGDKLLILGRRMSGDSISRFLTDGNPDSSFTNGVNPPGVATASSQCNIGTYGWLVPTSNGEFFQVSGQAFNINGQFVNGVRALKWTSGGLAATACTGQPPMASVSPASTQISGTTGTPIVSNVAPSLNNFLSAPTFALSQFSGSLPSGLTFNAQTGVISGTPTVTTTSTVFFSVSNGSQNATYTVSFNITSGSGGGGGGGGGGSMSCGGGASLNPSSRTVTGNVGQALTVAAPAVSGFSSNPSFVRTNNSFFPSGLTLDASTGAISGTPTSSAQYMTTSITVSAGNQTCYYSITWNITAPPCALGAVTSNVSGVTGDPNFGGSGYWGPTESGYRVNATGVVVGNDGNIYVMTQFSPVMNSGSPSTNSYGRLYKLSPAGVVDTSWGTNGYVLFDFLANNGVGNEFSRGLKKLSDGSLVIATATTRYGSGNQFELESFVSRVTTAGTIDSTWGTNGKAVLYGPTTVSGGSNAYVQSFDVDETDNIYALTSVSIGGGSTSTRIAKVSSTGVKSSTFGGSGDLTFSSSVYEFAMHPAGGFFISGSTLQSADATITKYDSNGVVDTSFGTNGVATIDKSAQESVDSITVVGDKIYALHKDMSSMMQPVESVIRLQANGSIDTTYGNAGMASLAALGSFNPWYLVPLNGGSVLLGGSLGMQSMSMGFVVVDSSGSLPSGVTSPAVLTSGTCEVEYYGNLPIAFGDGFLFAGGANMGNATALVKFSMSGFSGGGSGGGSTPAPTLVTSANQALLERDPGSEGMIINGQSVTVDTTRVEISAARTPASQRTPSQVAAIQAAGQALLQEFLASLPAGAVTNVAVVNTTTGAVMRNLVFDANGNSLDVPVEDIVILDGPSISLMIGSNNANITSDGKYQVGAGGLVGVVGAGLGANAPGEIVAMSTPTLLANFTTTANGELSQSAQLPNSIGVGDHTLVVASGTTYAVMGLRVVPSALPTTGLTEESGRTVVIALFTLVFAAVLVRSRRLTLLAR